MLSLEIENPETLNHEMHAARLHMNCLELDSTLLYTAESADMRLNDFRKERDSRQDTGHDSYALTPLLLAGADAFEPTTAAPGYSSDVYSERFS